MKHSAPSTIWSALGYSFTPEADSWKVQKAMGGGSLYNLGVYPIQSARHTKGKEPIYVTAQATTKRKDIFKEVDEIFYLAAGMGRWYTLQFLFWSGCWYRQALCRLYEWIYGTEPMHSLYRSSGKIFTRRF